MKNIAIACSDLRNEIKMILEDVGVDYPILWIDSNKSGSPAKLYKAIKQQLGNIDNVNNIVLIFRNWGIQYREYRSTKASLVFPIIEDWKGFLQARELRNRLARNPEIPFLLGRGNLHKETDLWGEFKYCLNKWGAVRTKKIFEDMLNEHRRVWSGTTCDTRQYEDGKLAEQQILGIIDLLNSPLSIVYKAFLGEFDSQFIILEQDRAKIKGSFRQTGMAQ